MGALIGAALALFSVAVVVYPLLRSRRPSRDSGPASGASPPEADQRLESIYDAIRTLRLEHQLGQVPDEVYSEQMRGYRLRAAAVLRHQSGEGNADPEWLLEQEVLLARAALRGASSPAALCPNSGAPTSPSADCPECGSRLHNSEPPSP